MRARKKAEVSGSPETLISSDPLLVATKQKVQVDVDGRVELFTPVRSEELSKYRDLISVELRV